MAISYRTIQDPGKRLRAPDKSMEAAGRGFAQGYATMSAIMAQVNAQREQAKREQEAKDAWRDQQMADVTDTTFVEKVHGSIHEGAYSWLKQKQQRYAELTDMLLQEGMNSRNEQWADIQNERKRIEGAYHNFSKNLDAFKTARQNTAEMRGPDIEGGEYNEVAKTPNSENALGFLYDREFEGGYGDIEIADDGSFTFPDTEWDGKPIGSGNLPTVVDMPYKQQQALQKRELMYGQEIKNKSFKIDDESNNARIRNEIHQEFRGMGVGELQAYILNDMDGEGGTPAFIGQLAPGENPEFTWKDHQGNEQKMFYNDLLQNKDAMVSFATANEYQGTLDYMKGMIPSEGTLNISKQQKEISDLRKTSVVNFKKTAPPPMGYDNWEDFNKANPGFEIPENVTGEGGMTGINEKASTDKFITNLSLKYKQSLSRPPYQQIRNRDEAFKIQFDSWKDDGEDISNEEARKAFDNMYEDVPMFTVDGRGSLIPFMGDINSDEDVTKFLIDKGIMSKADLYLN